MRTVASPREAMKRLADAMGAEVQSRGRQWRLTYQGERWPSLLPATGVLGRLIMIANSRSGLGMEYDEIWGLCKFDPGKTTAKVYGTLRETWNVTDNYWTGGETLRMLDAAEAAGRIAQ